MNRRQKPPPRRPRSPAYRQAFERLDAALEENTQPDNSERTDMLSRRLLGYEWEEQEETRPGVLPK